MQRGRKWGPFFASSPHAVPAQKHSSKYGEKPKKELCKSANRDGSPPSLSAVVKFNLSRRQAASWLHSLRSGASFRLERIDSSAQSQKALFEMECDSVKVIPLNYEELLKIWEGYLSKNATSAAPNEICTNWYLLWHRLVGVVTILCEDLFLSVKRNVRSRRRPRVSSRAPSSNACTNIDVRCNESGSILRFALLDVLKHGNIWSASAKA